MAGYDACISYNHGDDDRLAVAIRTGLQRLAKPWNRRRALNVFLDKAARRCRPASGRRCSRAWRTSNG